MGLLSPMLFILLFAKYTFKTQRSNIKGCLEQRDVFTNSSIVYDAIRQLSNTYILLLIVENCKFEMKLHVSQSCLYMLVAEYP